MGTTNKDEQFLKIFKNSIKIDARTISIKTLLSERNLRRINYTPYYQRNYVWDVIKQTFFIESVILGTEIPPLILFKSGAKIEVIDGRQRFETLKRFKENDIILSSKGLMALPALARQSFNKLETSIQEVFWNSNIRVFEFEIINEPDLDIDIEDKVKKEIFRRYNTGITPLTSVEVDNAKYDEDTLSDKFEEKLTTDVDFYNKLKDCFFSKETESIDLKEKMVNYLRRCFILNSFPIYQYAIGNDRTEILNLLYEFAAKQNIDEDYDAVFNRFVNQIELVFSIYRSFSSNEILRNRFLYECILWAIRIIDSEDIRCNILNYIQKLKSHYENNIGVYLDDNPHFYKSIMNRFSDTANIFNELTGFNFDIFIRKADFKKELKDMKQSSPQVINIINQLEGLRINKPSPISKPIDEIRSDIQTSKYLVRPSYQRQEKVTVLKASSIIESILLGINLPPIFIFLRKDGVKEVIDGQQRLLSVIGFLGSNYLNEEGKLVNSKNNQFKLKGLKISTELIGKNYSALTNEQKDKILDFDIDEIIIEQSLNESFNATDLFIRLNQKPYPIEQNSFEMWNSTVDKDVIQKIKEVTKQHISWFYSKESSVEESDRTDRMQNEELITILSYISYNNKNNPYNKILGLFPRQDRITCRLKDKTALTDFLIKLEKNATEKELFINCINKTNDLILLFGQLFGKIPTKDSLNEFFNVKNAKIFRRSFQDFYIIWLILDKISAEDNVDNEKMIFFIRKMLCLLRNVEGKEVNQEYMENFVRCLSEIK
jgi:hypothetical protein